VTTSLAAPSAALDVQADAIATAKRRWHQACEDGSSPARVHRLYEHYRELVIARIESIVRDRPAHTA